MYLLPVVVNCAGSLVGSCACWVPCPHSAGQYAWLTYTISHNVCNANLYVSIVSVSTAVATKLQWGTTQCTATRVQKVIFWQLPSSDHEAVLLPFPLLFHRCIDCCTQLVQSQHTCSAVWSNTALANDGTPEHPCHGSMVLQGHSIAGTTDDSLIKIHSAGVLELC